MGKYYTLACSRSRPNIGRLRKTGLFSTFFVCGSNRTVTTTDMYTLDTDRMMKIFLHFAFFGIFSVL